MGNLSRNLDVAELFALADALQAELVVSNGDQIDGKVTENIEVQLLGIVFPLKLEVVSSRVTWVSDKPRDQCLLIKGPGNLYLLALNEKDEGMIHIAALDGTKLDAPRIQLDGGFFETHRGKNLAALLPMFHKGMVGEAHRKQYDKEWLTGSPILSPPTEAVAS